MMMKRAIDVALAGAGLVLVSPVLAVSWAAIRLEGPGPAIFRQTRVGLHGRTFEILKLRTMRQDIDRSLGITPSGDPRVTRVGTVLRATKLDELPQLVNVVKGEMSLVGPRPELPKYVDAWDPEARDVILSVRPGITDPASVAFAREASVLAEVSDPEQYYLDVVLVEKQSMYVDYVRTRSFRGDLHVMLRTLRALVGGRHAGA